MVLVVDDNEINRLVAVELLTEIGYASDAACNGLEALHKAAQGGYAAILLDSAMGLAVQTMLPAGSGYTTLEFKISFIKAITKDTGPIRTEGRVFNVGRRAATAEARILDGTGRLLAHATTTCLVFEIPAAKK